ncbi:MAG TPA: Uma2 family endonuclease [Chitinophagaceae bacterium]|nr:Uma2 family endonuclease [Chitinophagaceae bacterium]HNA19027.1 Uma2 family endonuclease [Chitinophagaceae bacterium]HNA90726.1 Uma2 family endonuclease [Chitinophagaceae bacterium]HNA95589.1 Uma2 family endonuclease [Chitinophagaceae bacterium]HNC39157.1 Uma2 family endonuclease [Chitinophagaceae bacterium]
MSNAIKILPHYTYADYVQWEGKWEVIDGVPHAMSPALVPGHQIVAGNLHSEFRAQLKNCKKCQVSQPVDYLVADDMILQPDILIVCKPIIKKYLDFPPTLVAEVLSPATALKDRHTKYAIYESQHIPYYLIIDPDKKEVEVYALCDDKYQLMQQGKDFKYSFIIEDCIADVRFGEIWD